MKKWICCFMILVLIGMCGCSDPHKHVWQGATCENAAFCTGCGKTQGEPRGHLWQDATCTTARTCMMCKEIDGEPLEHSWQPATCTSPATCALCSITEGDLLEHTWVEATCTSGKHCKYCYDRLSDPLGHDVEAWLVTVKATCTSAGTQMGVCKRCGEELKEIIPLLEHTTGDWVITEQPGRDCEGKRAKICKVCDKHVRIEDYTVTASEAKSLYKKACKSYSYDEVARNPGEHKGDYAKFSGKVIQAIRNDYGESVYYVLRVGIKSGYSYYKNIIYVEYWTTGSETRILEDDMITMYGQLAGEKTYTSTMGSSITIPLFEAEYIDIK